MSTSFQNPLTKVFTGKSDLKVAAKEKSKLTELPAAIAIKVQAVHDHFRAQPLNHPGFPGKTIGDAHDAFARVSPKGNWKLPIDAVVTCSAEEANFIAQACEFMCGGGSWVEPTANKQVYRITHPGYYAVIGA